MMAIDIYDIYFEVTEIKKYLVELRRTQHDILTRLGGSRSEGKDQGGVGQPPSPPPEFEVDPVDEANKKILEGKKRI